MFNITNHQRNTNQNYNEVLSHLYHTSEWTFKNLQGINAGEVVEKRETSCAVGGNVNGYNHYGKQYYCLRVVSDYFVTLQIVAHKIPLSMGFPRQEYWRSLPFPSSGNNPDLGVKPTSVALAGGFLTTEPPGKPVFSPNLYKQDNNLATLLCIVTLYPSIATNKWMPTRISSSLGDNL